MSGRKIYWLTCMVVVLLAVVAAQATSHVRIVRLSYVDGQVQMDRANGQGLERAILNSPIVEGSRIVTGSNGLAEVEFENNTVVRLGEATDVRFKELVVNDAGDKVNEVELVRGTMYFDTRSAKNEIDRAIAAGETFVVHPGSQLRFMMIGDQVQAAVFNGEATVDNNGQLTRLKKNDTLTVDSNNPSGMVIAKGVDQLPLDKWDSERHAYQEAYSYNNTGYGSKGMNAYGYSDLSYYGAFQYLPGWGLAWQPYGASSWLGWDPYSSGAWISAFGGGYAWASAYPWGWMPYHYGSWVYAPAGGWFWLPGNGINNGWAYNNFQGTAPVVNGPPGYVAPKPPVVSAGGARPAIMVGVIGNGPAYLPDGRVPPNFRSAITDHSGLVGTNPGTTFAKGSGGAASSNSNSFNRSARSMATSRAAAPAGGHVFAAPPQPSLGYGSFGNPSLGGQHGGFGSHSQSGWSNSTSGTSHASSVSGHSSSNPK